jgi:hypothetical protein
MEAKGRLELQRDRLDPTRTLLVYNGHTLGSLSWEKCDELARAFRRAGKAARQFAETGVLTSPEDAFLKDPRLPFELRRDQLDATHTLMVFQGRVVASIPWQACLEVGASFTVAARKGEELAKAPDIIAQDALLVRTGAPFALTDNPRIRDASYNDAQWDPHVRRAMPLRAVPSPRQCGTPTLIKD